MQIVDHPLDASVGMINAVKAEFPPHLVTLTSVQWAGEHVRHRCVLAARAPQGGGGGKVVECRLVQRATGRVLRCAAAAREHAQPPARPVPSRQRTT